MSIIAHRKRKIKRGIRTFNLPDFTGRVPVYDSGSAIGTTSDGKLPNITGSADFSYGTLWPTTFTGALYNDKGNVGVRAQGERGSSPKAIKIDASLSSAVYTNGQSAVVPANVNCFWCIKF